MKIAILGSSGMLGHTMAKYYAEKYEITTFGRENADIYLDAENLLSVKNLLTKKHFDYIINCIGILVKESGEDPIKALKVNSVFPKFLETIFKDTKTKIIQISTDCVFNGEAGGYTENSFPNAKDVYGISKSLGEIDNNKDITIRTSIIGFEIRKQKTGLLEWYASNTEPVVGYTNAIWNGVTTLQLSKSIEEYLYNPSIFGIYHLPGEPLSKYELLKIFKSLQIGTADIAKGQGSYFINKTLETRKPFFSECMGIKNQLLELKNL